MGQIAYKICLIQAIDEITISSLKWYMENIYLFMKVKYLQNDKKISLKH